MPNNTSSNRMTSIKRSRIRVGTILGLIVVSLTLLSCTVTPPAPASEEATPAVQPTPENAEDTTGDAGTADESSYDSNDASAEETAADPFAYCAEVGTIDTPEGAFGGPSNPGVPEAVAAGLRQVSGTAEDAPIAENSYWRCMEGKVYACFVGANLPCASKSDTSTTPPAAMNEFCAAQPDAEVIPAAVTGRDTVYAWSCNGDTAEAGEQVIEVDAQGYPATFWYEIPPATPDTN